MFISNRRERETERELATDRNGKMEFWGEQRGDERTVETTVPGVLKKIMENLDKDDPSRPTVPLGHGDPSPFPCFRTTVLAEDAIVDAVRSAKFNSYPPTMLVLLPARR